MTTSRLAPFWSLALVLLMMGDPANAAPAETVTLGGGCFWCLEAIFQEVQGVEKVVSGYAGGSVANPDYKAVCAGTTGHAEVVQITFNPQQISLKELLEMFFVIHDPTTLNRQGADVGTQYRSVIFYRTPEQQAAAMKAKSEAQKSVKQPVVTEITALKAFYPAEGYHQNYFRSNPSAGYCSIVIAPKVQKFHKLFGHKLKKAP